MNLPTKITVVRLILTVVIIILLCFPFYSVGVQFPSFRIQDVTVELHYIIAGVIVCSMRTPCLSRSAVTVCLAARSATRL